jgi:hypothetical protein
MSARPTNIYPDISDILARKARGRRQMASLSFTEKLEILESLRARVEPIRRSRELRKNAGRVPRPRISE